MKAPLALAVATLALACGCSDRTEPDSVPPAPQTQAAGSASEVSTDPATTDPAPSEETTASSAAATAPECKEISETRPGACEPDSHEPPPAQ